jgi:hypothetical protein
MRGADAKAFDFVTSSGGWRSLIMNSTPSRQTRCAGADAPANGSAPSRRYFWRTDKRNVSTKLFTAMVSCAAVVGLVGCGRAAANATSTASQTPTVMSADNLAAAERSALGLFTKLPLNASDPSAGYLWTSGPSSAGHMSMAVGTRLGELGAKGYFSDGGACGEDYITGDQNGLFTEPRVVSAVAGVDGSVTVVIERGSSAPPDLTAVMTKQNGTWLASDLASGAGPAASIFSTNPNC